MADDDAREEDHERASGDADARRARRRGRGRARRARSPAPSFARSHGQPVVYVDRAVLADVARLPPRRAAVHDVRRRDRRRPPARRRALRTPTGVAPERFEVVANFLSHTRNRRVRVICAGARRPTRRCRRSRRVYPGHELPRARDLRPVRHRRSTATPTSRASSCPTTGTATRCARTTPPARVPVTFKGDPSPTMSELRTRATPDKKRRASSARPTRARRSCGASRARGRAHGRRHVAGGRARRHDDHQHGSAAPVDARRAAHS